MSEAIYDEQVAPLLRQAGEICQAHSMAMVTAVEYDTDGSVARIRTFPAQSGITLRMVDALMQSRGNLDMFLLSLARAGVDLSNCACVVPALRERQPDGDSR